MRSVASLIAAAQARAVAAEQEQLAAALGRILGGAITTAADRLEAHGSGGLAAAGEPAPHQFQMPSPSEMLDALQLEAQLHDELDGVYVRVASAVIRDTAAELGIGFDVRNRLAEGVLEQRGRQITNITESQRAVVMRLLSDAWRDGLSIPDAAKQLQRRGAIDSAARARMIARTEIAATTNAAGLEVVRLSGSYAYKVWTVADGARHPRHEDDESLIDQTVPVDSPFDVHGVPAMHPGDSNLPPADAINCRCVLTYSDTP